VYRNHAGRQSAPCFVAVEFLFRAFNIRDPVFLDTKLRNWERFKGNRSMGPEEHRHNDSGLTEGARRATGVSPESSGTAGPLGPGQRWSLARKREVVLRLLRGEPLAALSRELGLELYRLEQWKDKALGAIDAGLRERGGDPLEKELDAARKKIGELSMENELLRMRCSRGVSPLGRGRLKS